MKSNTPEAPRIAIRAILVVITFFVVYALLVVLAFAQGGWG